MIKFMFLLLLTLSQQNAPFDLLMQANAAYEQADYRTAAGLYEALIIDGIQDAVVYFNLGNAYYQLGQLGQALVNYRRAQQLNPRDAQISMNLARIRSERVDLQGEETTLIDRLAALTYSLFTLTEIAWVVFTLWTAWFITLTIWLLRRGMRPRLRGIVVTLGGLMIIGLLILGTRFYGHWQRPDGVVIELSAPVMSGPGDDYLRIYQLYAAAEMRVLEVHEEWARFILPDGRQGWIRREFVTIV